MSDGVLTNAADQNLLNLIQTKAQYLYRLRCSFFADANTRFDRWCVAPNNLIKIIGKLFGATHHPSNQVFVSARKPPMTNDSISLNNQQ